MSIQKAHTFLFDLIEVWSVNLCAIGITYTDAEFAMKALGWLIAGGYTSWKWINEYRDRKQKSQDKNNTKESEK